MRNVLAWGLVSVWALALLGLTACGDSSAESARATSAREAPAASVGAPGDGSAPTTPTAATAATAAATWAPFTARTGVDALGDALPPGAVARLGSNRLRHPSAVVGLAFGPDSRSLVSAGINGELLEWSVPSGKLLRTLGVAPEPTGALSASREGTVLALTRLEGDAQLVDGPSGLLIPPGAGLPEPRKSAAVSPDGRWLARWDRPFTDVSIEPLGGGAARSLYEPVLEFEGVAFDADGARVALLAQQPDGPELRTTHALLSLRDPASDEVFWRVEVPGETLYSAAFSPDGQRIYAGDGHGGVHVFDAASGEQLALWNLCAPSEPSFPVKSLAISPDGERLAVAHGASGILLDARSGDVLHVLAGHLGPVRAIAYAPDGSLVATACSDQIVRLFDPASGQRVSAPPGHETSIAHVLCAPDGRSICTIGSDGLCLLWPGGASGPPRELLRAPAGLVSVAYSPDGATLAICAAEPAISLYDVASATRRARWSTGLAGPAALVAFAPDGSALATAHFDEKVRLWSLADGKPVAEEPSLLTAPVDRSPTAFAWLPDGRFAVGTSLVKLFDGKSGTVVGSLTGTSPIAELACTRDGKLLASANADRTATLYRLDPAPGAGESLRSLGGHESRVYSVAFSPDGALLATGGAGDGTVHLWDVEGGIEIERLTGHEGDVRSLAFTPDGHALISAGADAAALVWAIPPERAESSTR